jgi:hypothetical protein
MRAYHYTNLAHQPGDIITSGRDSLVTFEGPKKAFEEALRSGHPDGTEIRSKALYTWADKGAIERIWKVVPAKYFYEVEIDDADVLFRSNLNHYNDGLRAAEAHQPFGEFIRAYWQNSDSWDATSRDEILVTKATIVRLLLSK